MRKTRKNMAALAGTVMILALSQAAVSYAGTWIMDDGGRYRYENEDKSLAVGWLETDGTWYYFDEDGWMKTGWIQDQGRWYYLSASTGAWTVPPVNESTAIYLMKNALADAGLFQDEENLDIKIESVTKSTIVLTVGKIDRPESFRGFAQYRVDRKTRKAESVFGGNDLKL
ncbi:hypothetical protein [Clostridium sp. chh4-2]|uniref:hypothetical protein n=1 Tax=Clostridium sp. chh4-2 TaxID=2067550 RepID=UPI0024202CB6|nr:hypothetical protein [Clostridium sp. chh4-2]